VVMREETDAVFGIGREEAGNDAHTRDGCSSSSIVFWTCIRR